MRKLTVTISPESCCAVIFANVDNNKIGDIAFREFVKKTLEIVDYNEEEPTGRMQVQHACYTLEEIDNFNMDTLKEIVRKS